MLKELGIGEKGVFGPWSIWTKLQFLELLEDEKAKMVEEEMEDEDDDDWLDTVLQSKQRTEESTSTSTSKQEEHRRRTKKRTLEATALIRNKDQKRQRLIDPKMLVGKGAKADREKVYVYTSA